MKVSAFVATVRRWSEDVSPEEREALRVLVAGIEDRRDPSGEIVRLVGEDRAAGFVQCWRDCQDGRPS